ncbi:uncharacterized protein LOC129747235 isoform X2 [Uranotaenia lowii]|uniref:uncharacterized protein LOC129747235 isoform X2 n=1 Tax=Uranotaenia lowii TaxID=190385 RepID=UPI0024787522|nr:uncharacterized protein LOC129747235 isoform X2 [Uranotaenia lowii]
MKAWPPGDIHRPIKRLFTPEIKRMLKDWLVRRRENPYPNREEKKLLACETGLTYTQICNWFANWRRKLKNSGHDPIRKTWSNLIKNYNTSARGNVEQFSICSSDSIWGERGEDSQGSRTPPSTSRYVGYGNSKMLPGNNNSHEYVNHMQMVARHRRVYSDTSDTEDEEFDQSTNFPPGGTFYDHCYTPKNYNAVFGIPAEQVQYLQASATIGDCPADFNANTSSIIAASFPNAFRAENGTYYLTPSTTVSPALNGKSTSKYKNSIMEKYLRDLSEVEPDPDPSGCEGYTASPNPFQLLPSPQAQVNVTAVGPLGCEVRSPPSLSKWLESTAKFTPSKNNYIDWEQSRKLSSSKKRCNSNSSGTQLTHQLPCNSASSQGSSETSSYTSTEMPVHQKDEIDAAEALTRLANNFRMKFYT